MTATIPKKRDRVKHRNSILIPPHNGKLTMLHLTKRSASSVTVHSISAQGHIKVCYYLTTNDNEIDYQYFGVFLIALPEQQQQQQQQQQKINT